MHKGIKLLIWAMIFLYPRQTPSNDRSFYCNKFISELSNKHDIGVLLVDFVIGYGATSDPAGALIQEIKN